MWLRCYCLCISIHAPHTRSDYTDCVFYLATFYFNPRSPYEERPRSLPSRGATLKLTVFMLYKQATSVAPFTGSDSTIIAPLSLRLKHNFFANLSTTLLFSLIRLCQQVLFTNGWYNFALLILVCFDVTLRQTYAKTFLAIYFQCRFIFSVLTLDIPVYTKETPYQPPGALPHRC